MMQIRRPRESLRVWWKKCGTRNDSSAGSRPDRQARGDILIQDGVFSHPETKLSPKRLPASHVESTSVASVRYFPPSVSFPPRSQGNPQSTFRRPTLNPPL